MHSTDSFADTLRGSIETQGATLPDIAASLNTTIEDATRILLEQDVGLPNSLVDNPANTLIEKYRRVIEFGKKPPTPEELLGYPNGTTLGYPAGFTAGGMIDIAKIYQAFHGEKYIDAYTGLETDQKLYPVNGNTGQFIITNWETLGEETIEKRFTRWMPPCTETFWYPVTDELHVTLTITRQYDALVGGTYEQRYIDALVDRWMIGPVKRYLNRSPEFEPVFKDTQPYTLAWWAWLQLTHFGLLKGLSKVEVSKHVAGPTRTATLTDSDVAKAIIHHQHKDGTPRIQANVDPQAARAPRLPRTSPIILK